jgi:short-subunit dehydrogenase
MHLREDTAAVVTGGGSGIGLAIADALAARGCRLALIDVREDRLESARARFAPIARDVSIHTADVRDENAITRAAAEIRRAHGDVSLLVNSAGVSLAAPFAEADRDSFDWVMRVNFGGTVRCCRIFLPQMFKAGVGHIANISSCFGWVGFPGKTAYSASKFAIRGFSESLRSELRGSGIGVTVVYPGPVDTNLVRDGRSADSDARTREVEFLARRGIPADHVAQRVIRAIVKNSPRAVVGFDYRAIDLLVRLAPNWSASLIGQFGPRFSWTDESR